jgi:hypothetical protein
VRSVLAGETVDKPGYCLCRAVSGGFTRAAPGGRGIPIPQMFENTMGICTVSFAVPLPSDGSVFRIERVNMTVQVLRRALVVIEYPCGTQMLGSE